MSFFPFILVSGCVHATSHFRGRDMLTVLSPFFFFSFFPVGKQGYMPCYQSRIQWDWLKCANILGQQLKKISLRKFLFNYQWPLYTRNWNVNNSIHFISVISLSVFTHCKLLLRLYYHSDGHSSPHHPLVFTGCMLCWFLLLALETVSIEWSDSVC